MWQLEFSLIFSLYLFISSPIVSFLVNKCELNKTNVEKRYKGKNKTNIKPMLINEAHNIDQPRIKLLDSFVCIIFLHLFPRS